MTAIPANIDAERALITAAMLNAQAFLDVTHMLDPASFFKPQHQHIWAAIEQISPNIDPILLAEQLARDGFVGDDYTSAAMNRYFCDPNVPATCISHAPRYARSVADAAASRQLVHLLSEAGSAAMDGLDPTTARDDLIGKIQQVSTSTEIRRPATAAELRASTPQEYNWAIPDFLERKNRLMVTGSEGAGKSVLLMQIGFMAAAGVHPWTRQPFMPIRVLVVDLENDDRMISRRIGMMEHAIRVTAKEGGLGEPWNDERIMIEPRSEGINLLKPGDRNWLMSLCAGADADLLIIGPTYRMMGGAPEKNDAGGEDQARMITASIDMVRHRTGVAVIMETHAGHGSGGAGRDLRPVGSSVWLRWPEFGVGLRPLKDEPGAYEFDHWRNPRDERRWPTSLYKDGRPWPWMARMG